MEKAMQFFLKNPLRHPDAPPLVVAPFFYHYPY